MQYQIDIIRDQLKRVEDDTKERHREDKEAIERNYTRLEELEAAMVHRIESHERDEQEVFKQINKKLENIERNMLKQKGFVGGIVFIVSSLGWGVYILKDWIVSHWK